jgi:CBS domain containing-hemolysin-like protein
MNTLGRIPRVGDEVAHESLALAVERMIGRRLHSLIIKRLPSAEPAGARQERE